MPLLCVGINVTTGRCDGRVEQLGAGNFALELPPECWSGCCLCGLHFHAFRFTLAVAPQQTCVVVLWCLLLVEQPKGDMAGGADRSRGLNKSILGPATSAASCRIGEAGQTSRFNEATKPRP